MNKTVCIYPKDETTDFLEPLYDLLCQKGYYGWHDDSVKNREEALEKLKEAEEVIFLGHGSSCSLYGSPENNELTILVSSDNVQSLLGGKKCFLLSCNSEEFCINYSLKPSIGFGNMPTGMYDVHIAMEYDVSFPNLGQIDIDAYNMALLRTLCRTFKSTQLDNLDRIYAKIRLYSNVEIVECLTKKPCEMYREVAELLQDFKNECKLLH